MASHTPRFTSRFLKNAKKLKSPLRTKLEQVVHDIIDDPRRGKPLTHTLKGLWSKRVDGFRIIYEIQDTDIVFYAFEHRRNVYKKV